MKKSILSLFLCVTISFGYSQASRETLSGAYTPTVKQDKLNNAALLGDLLPNYLQHLKRTIEYVSVEILARNGGKEFVASNTSDTLSADQKNILRSVDPGTNIVLKVRYVYKDPANFNKGRRPVEDMQLLVTMVPTTEAEFQGGSLHLAEYLKVNLYNKIAGIKLNEKVNINVAFTVNEDGMIDDIKLSGNGKGSDIEKIILKTIETMPAWKPAENSKGIKVKQEFNFGVPVAGGNGC